MEQATRIQNRINIFLRNKLQNKSKKHIDWKISRNKRKSQNIYREYQCIILIIFDSE